MRALALLELGGVLVGLSVLARLAGRAGIPPIPLYLLAGLAFGDGGLLPLVTTKEFIETGGEIGLVLLLFMLGLEYSAAELTASLRSSRVSGLIDLLLNFPPGLFAGLVMGWELIPSLFLGGITYVTSSGIVAKLLHDLQRIGNRETPVILSILVMEDLAMAVYLPVLGALLLSGATVLGLVTVVAAVAAVVGVLALALRVEVGLSRLIFSHSDEVLLLSLLGFAVVVAGVAEFAQVSAAVGALLAGIVLSGPAAEGARALLSPLRDLFAALFFAFIGLTVDPGLVVPAIPAALALAGVGTATKFVTGWWSARWAGVGVRGRIRAGTALIPRGEFSIAIAGLGVSAGLEPDLAPVTVAYVLVLAVVGPVVTRVAEPIWLEARRRRASAGLEAPTTS